MNKSYLIKKYVVKLFGKTKMQDILITGLFLAYFYDVVSLRNRNISSISGGGHAVACSRLFGNSLGPKDEEINAV